MKSNIVVLACTVDFRIGTLCTKSFNCIEIYTFAKKQKYLKQLTL